MNRLMFTVGAACTSEDRLNADDTRLAHEVIAPCEPS